MLFRSAFEQAKVQGSVATKMEGRAGVLTAEIKLDQARGDDVEKKKEELAEVEKKAIEAESAQMNTLADANKELEEAAKADQKIEKAEEKEDKKDITSIKEDKNVTDTEAASEMVNPEVEVSAPETVVYTHVDVRL